MAEHGTACVLKILAKSKEIASKSKHLSNWGIQAVIGVERVKNRVQKSKISGDLTKYADDISQRLVLTDPSSAKVTDLTIPSFTPIIALRWESTGIS